MSPALALICALVLAAAPTPRERVGQALHAALSDPKAEAALLKELDARARALAPRLRGAGARPAEVREVLERQVAANLEDKLALVGPAGEHFTLTAEQVRRQVIGYEAFKLEAYVASGVFPKCYFGYLDGRWDTAPYERKLAESVRAAAELANALLAERKSKVRVTEAEIAVTFLAEGGAILLRERQLQLESVEPVMGIGLDDIATGFKLYPELVQRLDEKLGARLDQIVVWKDGQAYLARNFTFVEAVAGTAVMWVYEKERCEGLLRKAGRPSLATLDLHQQFVLASLVYNSGKTFDPPRLEQIAKLTTGDYLYAVSVKNAAGSRGALPVLPPARAFRDLYEAGAYPEQPTRWSAVYHVLQRYGAYLALERFGGVEAGGELSRLPGGPG